MRDSRLIRQRHSTAKKTNGILLVALGNRNRYKDFGEEAAEERTNDKTQMYLR